MTPRRLTLSLTISLAALLLPTAAARAAGCDYWYGPGGNSTEAKSGEWGTGSNWSTGEAPVSADQACITVPGTYTVTLTPYFATFEGNETAGDHIEDLALGASSGTQTLQILGEGSDVRGDWYNETFLSIANNATIKGNGHLILDATESNAPSQSETPAGGNAMIENGDNAHGEGTFINEGTIVAAAGSSRWGEKINSRDFTNSGHVQVESGTLRIHNEQEASSTGGFGTAAGATLAFINLTKFVNDGDFTNDGATLFEGYPSKEKWVQGPDAVTGNAVEIQSGASLEDGASSGTGAFTFGNGGGGAVIGTIPRGQTVTLASTAGQCTLWLANGTLVNEGTLHLDVPAGSESNTNVEEGSIVNRGTIYGTVEGANAKNVIDVPLTDESAGVLAASSGTLFDNREITNGGHVEMAAGSILELVAAKLVNGGGGTIAPQISGASTFGKITLASGAAVQAAGTLAPTLAGGYTPSAGTEFDVIEGATVSGTFGTVSGGFYADYSHETASAPFVGVVYGTASSISSTPGRIPATPRVTSIKSVAGKVVVKLSCPAGSSGCTSVTVKITVTEHFKRGRVTAVSAKHDGKSKGKTKLVVIAIRSALLSAGKTASVSLSLNRTGAHLLEKHRELHALVTVSAAGKALRSQKVTITAAKAKRKHG